MKRPIMLTLFLAAAAAATAAQVPATAPAPAPAPIPVPTGLLAPPVEPRSPHQPIYGPILRVLPAHRLAMLEAGEPLLIDSPQVKAFALLLSQATARYAEDAPAIADLTARTCLTLRGAYVAASPRELIEAALVAAKRPNVTRIGVPRSFEAFAAQYGKTKLEQPRARTNVAPPPARP